MASSSGLCRIPSRSNSPLSIFRAKSVMYSAFRKVMPKLCSFSTPALRTAAASTTPNSSRIRFQMVACAFVEICWPTMWCTTAEKRSVSTSLSMCPACAMTAAIRSSLALRYAVSASPYWKYIRSLLHVTTFCLNTGCYVDYSKKYVYLQYKKRPPHSIIPYSGRVIFPQRGMGCGTSIEKSAQRGTCSR